MERRMSSVLATLVLSHVVPCLLTCSFSFIPSETANLSNSILTGITNIFHSDLFEFLYDLVESCHFIQNFVNIGML